MACYSGGRAGAEEEESCGDCMAWEEEIYWKRLRSLHFCQILQRVGEFRKELVIPKKFARNVRVKLPQKVTLRGPNFASWDAMMTRRGDDVFLSDGWEEFARAFSLQQTNILVFKYDGVSAFDVLIFDGGSLCEKESANFVRKLEPASACADRKRKRVSTETDLEERSDKASKQARDEFPRYPRFYVRRNRKPMNKNPLVSSEYLSHPSAEHGISAVQNAPSKQKPHEVNETCATEAHQDAQLMPETPQTNGGQVEASLQTVKETDRICQNEATVKTSLAKSKSDGKFLSVPSRHGKKRRNKIEIKAKVPSEKIRTKASLKNCTSSVNKLKGQPGTIEAAGARTSESPDLSDGKNVSESAFQTACKQMTESSFINVMRPANVYGECTLGIPVEWYKKHLFPKSQDLFLSVGEKVWLTNLEYIPGKATGFICGDWKQFVDENQLQVSDICLFDLQSQSNDATMLEVSIFRSGFTMRTP